MSKFKVGDKSYGHRVQRHGCDYLISWVVKYRYPNSPLRFPRTFVRWTDITGAERFRKKWGIK
jgi:hypothetical protein